MDEKTLHQLTLNNKYQQTKTTSKNNVSFSFLLFCTGVLQTYHIIVRGYDGNMNRSRILTNVTIDATAPTLLLANLTEGVTYTVSVAAANRAGYGPYSAPATLRLDPITKRLDQSTLSHRYVTTTTTFLYWYI